MNTSLRNGLILITLLMPSVVHGEDEEKAVVPFRKALMSSMANQMKLSSFVIKGKIDNSVNLPAFAQSLQAAGNDFASLWPAETGVGHGESMSLPAVWEKPDEWAEAIKMYQTATKAFVDAQNKDAAEVETAFRNVGKSCGSCHKVFRKKND